CWTIPTRWSAALRSGRRRASPDPTTCPGSPSVACRPRPTTPCEPSGARPWLRLMRPIEADGQHAADGGQVATGLFGPPIEGGLDSGEVALAAGRAVDHALADQCGDHVGCGDECGLADCPQEAAG